MVGLMYIPKTPNARTEFLLSCSTIFFLCLSGLYFLLLLWGELRLGAEYHGFSPIFGAIVVLCAYISFVLNKRKYTNFSLLVLSMTLLTICTLAGIWWGFDLPSVLLGYFASIVIVAVTGNKKQNLIHLSGLSAAILFGFLYRTYSIKNPVSWHQASMGINDIIEFILIFSFITALLLFANREQQKLLDRSKRSEFMLKDERDNLEAIVEKRTKELKQLQMEQLGEMYRFVEFGKLSSGLFHDLMSPIQTLKVYIESFKQKETSVEVGQQFRQIQQISSKIEDMLNAMRTQIRVDSKVETFDVLADIHDLVLMTRYLHLKHNIEVDVVCDLESYTIQAKRTMLNHILLNLLSNACEACIPISAKRECKVTIRVGRNPDKKLRHYISIEDTGVGIEDSDLPHIFDPFFSTKKDDGEVINCGIGLSSAKHAIEKHLKGKLYVESDVGIGTTMTVLF